MVDIGTTARAFWTTGPSMGEIREECLPPTSIDTVHVETLWSGVSRGTEALVFQGGVPESEWRRMRCPFQEGDFPSPVKYGYAAVGVVRAGPDSLLNRPVFCLFPHQDRFVVPVLAPRPIPDGVPPARAVLAANMETALNALWDAEPIGPSDHVCVIGAGVVGLLSAYLVKRLAGADPLVVDTVPAREAVAAALGLRFTIDPPPADAHDLVLHASASASGLATALETAGFEGRVIELSWYGDREVPVPLGAGFHAKRLTLKASQVGSIAPSRRPTTSHADRLDRALALLDDPALDHLISGEDAFEDLPRVMAALADGAVPALCHRIRYLHQHQYRD